MKIRSIDGVIINNPKLSSQSGKTTKRKIASRRVEVGETQNESAAQEAAAGSLSNFPVGLPTQRERKRERERETRDYKGDYKEQGSL